MVKIGTVIILSDYNYINGGISQMAITLANALAEQGRRVIFFSAVTDPSRLSGVAGPVSNASDLSPKVENYSTDQPDILNDPSRLHALKQGIWNKKAAAELKAILAISDPAETILHLHSWAKALSPSIGRVLTHSGFPLVYTIHDYFMACPNGGFYNYQLNKICHLRAMSLACICTNCDSRNYGHKLWRVARQAVQLQAGDLPAGIKNYISVTGFSENILRSYLPAAAEIFRVNNPVTHTLPGRPRRSGQVDKMLYIGRLSPEKGTELACEAARRASTPLVIIGDGPLKQQLQEKYPEVEFKGWLSSPDVFAEMLKARALLFPSVCYETAGLVVLEALSVGLPVIVSDQSAASEFVDQQNGFTFKTGDADDLAEKIRQLANDPGKAETMSRHAYDKYWQRPYPVDRYIADTLSVYTKILEKEVIAKTNT